jgi:hypothetical protein
MNIAVLWEVMPCSLADHYRRLGATRCLSLQARGVMTETACSSETSVTIYQYSVTSQKTTTLRFIRINHQ